MPAPGERQLFTSFGKMFSNTPRYRPFLEFLKALDEFANSVDPQGDGGNAPDAIFISPGSTGGGSGGAPTITQIISSSMPVELPDSPSIARGMAVSYRRGTVVAAANTDTANPANFACGYKQGGKMFLYGSWHLGELLLAPGAGSNALSTLYLSTGGLSTDDQSTIVQPAYMQELGTLLLLSGIPPFGFARCVFAPRTLYL